MTSEGSGGMNLGVNEPRKKEDRASPLPPSGEEDGVGSQGGFFPRDLRRGILAAITQGGAGSVFAKAAKEREFLATKLPALAGVKAEEVLIKGKEHLVVRKGRQVWKFQDGPALIPIAKAGKLDVREALPSEYLERLDLQNALFGDDVRIEGILKNGKLVISQSLIQGMDPTEKEVEAFLKGLGWKRVPANLQLLPNNLMATAWGHAAEKVVMVDARPPNFKKTKGGAILAIDLMLIKASGPLLELMKGAD